MNESFPSQIDLLAAAESLTETWSPRVVARVNDQYVKVAKVKGVLTWHCHEDEDELFFVVPRGVMHNPVAEEECLIVLIETVTTKHTGDIVVEKTRTLEEQLGRA
jgi:mannose-6-phosphate isomerase-like protein (cupin superfamily)